MTTDRRRVLIGVSAWLIGTLPFLVQLVSGRTLKDMEHYLASARAVLDGAGIYTIVPFEYPPYALAWFVLPAVFAPELERFRVAFGLLIWGLDAAVKAALVWQGCRRRDRGVDLLPFLLYTLATAALARIIQQRYDVIPAAVSFAAAVLLTSGWPLLAGMAIAAAVGTKLFPAVYVPIMAAFAWRRSPRDLWRLVAGGAVGSLPLVALSWMVPWWNFLGFHASRGLEAGSLWASVIWLGHYAGVPATWEVIVSVDRGHRPGGGLGRGSGAHHLARHDARLSWRRRMGRPLQVIDWPRGRRDTRLRLTRRRSRCCCSFRSRRLSPSVRC